MKHTAWAALLLLLAGLVLPAAGHEEPAPRCANAGVYRLCAEQSFPQEGRPCRILLTTGEAPLAGAWVTALVRPNSEVSRLDTLGRTDAAGTVHWTPTDAGLATLTASRADSALCELTVAVRFPGVPALGLVMLLVAGLLLFGGNSYSFAKTFGRAR
ncbi:MAG: hypothetical protein GF330_06310 [Candidatus Eisenbacteria bacterium]|nr:hypothetical protein [Candidatus Eisenbacteria bacterium]